EEAVFREVVSFTPEPLPARYYDKDTTKPVSFYFSSLEELLAWTPDVEDSFNVALEPSECRQPPLSSQRPRTLLCHDMMGGYLEDKFIQGSAARSPYCFYHWQCIDIFVYFSHHTVTIPPVGWTNAAHRHGVCVLGTFITEWKDGAQLCEAFLAGDERSYRAVADQLVLIAQFFRFDGWLVNIENSLSVTSRSSFLTRAQLGARASGGLGGPWRRTRSQAAQGPGPGEKASLGNLSLELIRKHGFSAALFAPGWVYECLEKKDFFQNQDKFWALLERYLPTHSICSLPFVTSFCLGMGTRRVRYGQEEAVGPWYHPSAQEIQPLFAEHRLEGDGRGWVRTSCCLEDAWCGGSSLLIRGVIPPEVGPVAVRLFSLHVPVPPKIFLSLVYKLEGPSAVEVALELTTGDAGSCHVGGLWTLDETSSRHSPRPLRVPPTKLARWVGRCGQQLPGGWVQRCYEVNLRGCLLGDLLVSFARPAGSREEASFVCRLGEIQVVDADSLLRPLPRVQALTVSRVCWQPATSEEEEEEEGGAPARLRLSCTLHWSYLLSPIRCFRIHCLPGSGGGSPRGGPPGPDKPVLLGLAFVNQYRVVELPVVAAGPGRDGRVQFLVEPVPKEGFLVPQAEWGRAALLYSLPQL
uniref:mannosyl-glycoprotein endo-beta-N-acetylglucosaminidase n=1 Tax=Neovison vison TaxID=452646 RepID=A0A8C7BFY8_NEOVI